MENQIIKHLKEYMENTSDEQFEKDIEELIKKYPYCTINNEIFDEDDVEQAANKELFSSYATFDGEFKYDSNAMINMFIKGANWKFEHMWIDIEENGYPPYNENSEQENYLLRFVSGSIAPKISYKIGYLTRKYKFIGEMDWVRVTHWMPIPKM